MDYASIIQLQKDQRTLSLPFPISRRRVVRDYISINDLVAIPVENTASFYNRAIDLPIKKTDGTEIGYFYFTKGIEVSNLYSLSEPKFVCYLIDIPSRTIIDSGVSHTFSCDYVIIYRNFLIEYLEQYFSSGPIWGFFNHKYSTLSINPPMTKSLTEITVERLDRFSDVRYFEASVRGIKHSLVFERFLKYYHLLELNFDYDVIQRIKNLNITTNSASISILLNEYKNNDIERLKYLFNTYCGDTNSIVEKMKAVSVFVPLAEQVFYVFGKESNPLKDFATFSTVAAKPDGFSFLNCRTAKISNASNANDHKKFIANLSAYWIYRIRNSIAHNKIGEYIMTHNDEEFVLKFAEPLLVELLRQLFK